MTSRDAKLNLEDFTQVFSWVGIHLLGRGIVLNKDYWIPPYGSHLLTNLSCGLRD